VRTNTQRKQIFSSVPEIDIRSAVLVVRLAELVRHERVLTMAQTKEAHRIVKKAWDDYLADEYLAKAAEVFGVLKTQLAIRPKEIVRHRMDGKTPMVDFPRVYTVDTKEPFDQRSCVALCIHDVPEFKYSSKVWTRVGPPQSNLGCPPADIRTRTRRYRRQAKICGEWFYGQFMSLTEEVFARNSPSAAGRLEVTTIGLHVEGERDEDLFDEWLLSNDSPNSENDDLFRYLAAAADLDIDLRDPKTLGQDDEWKSIPHTVELPNRELASRQFVYLVRKAEDMQLVTGIGFDDSGRGELASDVALKISRYMANRI
jgi:hypothetical protein